MEFQKLQLEKAEKKNIVIFRNRYRNGIHNILSFFKDRFTSTIAMSKGQTTIPIMGAISVLFVWSSALSLAMYNDHATISGIASDINNIKDTVATKTDISDIKSIIQSSYRPTYLTRSFASTTQQ